MAFLNILPLSAGAAEQFAYALADLICQVGIRARVNRRRSSYAVYVKSAEDVRNLLHIVGARRCDEDIEDVRAMKSVKNDVNRLVNAELARCV